MRHGESRDDQPLILLANDQEWTLRSLETILVAAGYRIDRAYTGRQALDRAGKLPPDLAILDLQLPDLSGLEVCRTLHDDPTFGPALPVIITTASTKGRSHQQEVFEAGAWDFFVQPLDGQLVLAKVRTFVAARAAFDRARVEGLTDPETRLYNMRGLIRRTRELGRDAARHGVGLTCIALSPTDPALGSAAKAIGTLVAQLGEAVARAVRGSDAIGRVRPLEFAIVAPAIEADGALRMVERIEATLTESGLPIRLHAGISTLPAPELSLADPADLLRRASEALTQGAPATSAA